MKTHSILIAVLGCCVAGALLPSCFAADQDARQAATPDASAPAPAKLRGDDRRPLPRFAIGLSAGTLGAGIQAATAVARHTNLRGGFNFFSLGLSGTDSKNSLTYDATLRVASAEILLDQYLKGGFHISGGALIYNGFRGTGNVSVAGGQNLSLNDVPYYSAPADPVKGTAALSARKAAPEVLIGFGNLLPRSARHFSVGLDLGVVFQGSPNAKLNLLGSTCTTSTTGCSVISSNATTQNNILAEQTKINNDLKPFQFYPVIRIGFGYNF